MKEGLLAPVVGTGIQVMYAMMDADVTPLVGLRGMHDPDRSMSGHGREDIDRSGMLR